MSSSDSTFEGSDKKESDNSSASNYECNICFDVARDAVVSMCGHLFCWPCIHRWMTARSGRMTCPVCKADINEDKFIPLYGRNTTDQQDPRKKVPPRPQGQRQESENTNGGGFNLGENFSMSFGIGAFPFGVFSTFNVPDRQGHYGHGHTHGPAPNQDEQFLSKVFLYVAVFFIFWLILA
ncbi:DgyrCDS9659 [Dimorphilus gyrociliatus]|uniref:RING-type E3 ubiquitin transferase n=1 Tax=Dimorphilus gyrociliatus TaxID=2664684 RepID=A0A7I8VZA1_9ANNE|nr:DgyrCDS9659 [Dimorphilus gyrociliatus]